MTSHVPVSRQIASKAFAYAGTPMFVLDLLGNIVLFNHACRVLLGSDIAGCMNRSWRHFIERIARRLDGVFASEFSAVCHGTPTGVQSGVTAISQLVPIVEDCWLLTQAFGRAHIRSCLMPLIASDSGDRLGSLVQLDVVSLEGAAQFHSALEKRWKHELMWEVYAASYDRLLPQLPFYQEVVLRHCQTMARLSIRRVLDMGAGTGSVTLRLAKKGKFVTAVDTCSAMLAKLYCKLDGTTVDRVVVIEDSAERLPQLPDGSFDGVTALLAFYDMQAPYLALAEAIRLLAPGGILVLTDPKSTFRIEVLMSEAERVFREKGTFDRIQDDWNRILVVQEILSQTIREAQNPNELENKKPWHAEAALGFLTREGFLELNMEDSHLGNCATVTGVKPLD